MRHWARVKYGARAKLESHMQFTDLYTVEFVYSEQACNEIRLITK